MTHPVAYFEITSADAAAAQKFYESLFDWKLAADPDMDGYAMVDTGAGDDAISGGIGPAQGDEDAGIKIYVRVEDLDHHLSRAEELGGQRVLEPMELPGGYGSIAAFTDPDGNVVGLWA